jgi:hypothetical protein
MKSGVDAVVELPVDALAGGNRDEVVTVVGDPEAFTRLVGFLDTELVGFYMHQR